MRVVNVLKDCDDLPISQKDIAEIANQDMNKTSIEELEKLGGAKSCIHLYNKAQLGDLEGFSMEIVLSLSENKQEINANVQDLIIYETEDEWIRHANESA